MRVESCFLLPLDGAGGFRGYVVDDAVDAADCVDGASPTSGGSDDSPEPKPCLAEEGANWLPRFICAALTGQ